MFHDCSGRAATGAEKKGGRRAMSSLPLPLPPPQADRTARFHRVSPATRRLTRGVCRLLTDLGMGPVTEFRLPNNRRADVMGLDQSGRFTIVEVKTSLADFRADTKWPEYLPWCDLFYFAVPEHFPLDVIPEACGLIVADGYGAAIRREVDERKLHPTRRRHQLLRFALTASERLQRLYDPEL